MCLFRFCSILLKKAKGFNNCTCDKRKIKKHREGAFLFLAYPKGFDSQRELRALVAGGSDSPPDCHSAPPLFESFERRSKTEAQVCLCLAWPTRKDSNLRPSESESDALSSCATGRCISSYILSFFIIFVNRLC